MGLEISKLAIDMLSQSDAKITELVTINTAAQVGFYGAVICILGLLLMGGWAIIDKLAKDFK
jgi:hypothetical protein